jgi:hypothetical protein
VFPAVSSLVFVRRTRYDTTLSSRPILHHRSLLLQRSSFRLCRLSSFDDDAAVDLPSKSTWVICTAEIEPTSSVIRGWRFCTCSGKPSECSARYNAVEWLSIETTHPSVCVMEVNEKPHLVERGIADIEATPVYSSGKKESVDSLSKQSGVDEVDEGKGLRGSRLYMSPIDIQPWHACRRSGTRKSGSNPQPGL